MKFSIGAGKYKKAFLASALFVFALFAGGEFIKASTYDKVHLSRLQAALS